MNVKRAVTTFIDNQKENSGKNTVKNYGLFLAKVAGRPGHREVQSVAPDEMLTFLTGLTEGQRQTTKR